MGNQWIASRRPFLCIVLLAILNAGSVAWATQGPPVPGQAMVEIEEPLILIEAAMLVHGQLQILARPGSQLVIREPFILRNPARLVIDVSGAKLGNVGLPFPPASIGGVVVNTVRFGQMDAETVRIVVETDDPERLQVAVQENRLMVSASRGAGILANVSRYLFGRGPSQPESYGKPSIPPPLPTPSPKAAGTVRLSAGCATAYKYNQYCPLPVGA
jgi:hypothetical protein